MKNHKKQAKRCKNTAHRDQRMQELRDILMSRVPIRIREIVAEGKANDDTWLVNQVQWAKSVNPSDLFAQGKAEEWLVRLTEMFAVLSFVSGGSTAALGTKLFGIEFDAEKIIGRKVRDDRNKPHSNVIYRQEEPFHIPPDTYLAGLTKIDQQAFEENATCALMRPVHPSELRNIPSDIPRPVPENIEFVLVLNPGTQEHVQEHIKPLAGYGEALMVEVSGTSDGDPIHTLIYLTQEQAMRILATESSR